MTITRKTLQAYAQWALTYNSPKLPENKMFSNCTYCYYSPFDDKQRERGFYYTMFPLPLEQLRTGRLIPATLPARIQFALDYTQGEAAQVWKADTGGYLLAYYEPLNLWGQTAFTAREGKQGTILAKTRESLMVGLLNRGYVPCLGQIEHLLHLPGMQNIRPVFLETAQMPQDSLFLALQRYQVQAATDDTPFFVLEEGLCQWLITILCEERSMTMYRNSRTCPMLAQVLSQVLSVATVLESYPDRQTWEKHNGAEEDPYEICVMQANACKEVLGEAYPDFLYAFRDTEATRTLIVSSPLS